MTLATLRTDVRDRLSETTAGEWTNAMLDRWINEGLKDVARRTQVIQDRENVTAVVGTKEYAMPIDILGVYRVDYTATGSTQTWPLEYRDFNTMDSVWWSNQDLRSTPSHFTLWGFPPALKMIVYPVPSVAGIFVVFHYRLPATLVADGDVPEIPAGWDDLVVTYCEYLALRRDHDPRWQEAKSLYESNLDNLYTTTRRWTDQAGTMVSDSGVTLPWWVVGTDF